MKAAELKLLSSTQSGTVTSEDVLNACIPLVYSKSTSLLERGVFKLAELLREKTNLEREIGLCALYHLALGHYKLGDERTALGLVQSLLAAKSFHTSAVALKQICIDKMISKQKSSGLFSRLMRKKDDPVTPVYSSANLTFLTEEEERTKQSQAEKDRDFIASLAPPSPPDSPFEGVDEIALSPHSSASPTMATSPSGSGLNMDQYGAHPFDSDASSASFASLSPSSSQQSFLQQHGQPAAFGADGIENSGFSSSHPSGTSSAPNSIALNFASIADAGAGTRGSSWIRSRPKDGQSAERRPSSAFFSHAAPEEAPVEKKTRKIRPLRASQSQRSAPTLSFLPDGRISETPAEVDENWDDEEDWDDEELEQTLVSEIAQLEIATFNFPAFAPSFIPGSGLYTDSHLTARQVTEAEALHAQHAQQIELAKAEYQALLQSHQAAQYELLRVQQEEVSLLNEEQLALLEEEKAAVDDPDRLAQLSPRFRALTDRQGPLLVKQQEDQGILVEQQGVEQKARQESFRQLLFDQQNEKAGMTARHESELGESEQMALHDEEAQYEARKSVAAADFEGSLFSNLALKRERLDSLRTERVTRETEREAKRVEKARLAAEAEALRLKQQRAESERLRLQVEEEARLAQALAEQEAARVLEAQIEDERKRVEAEAIAAQARDAERQRLEIESQRLEQERQQEERELAAQREAAAKVMPPTSPSLGGLPPAPAPLAIEQAPGSMPMKIQIGSPPTQPLVRAPSGGIKSPLLGPARPSPPPALTASSDAVASFQPPSHTPSIGHTTEADSAVEGDVIDVFALAKRVPSSPGVLKRPVSMGPAKTHQIMQHAHSTNEQGLARNVAAPGGVPSSLGPAPGAMPGALPQAPQSLKYAPSGGLSRPAGPPPSAPPKMVPPAAPPSSRIPITKSSSTNSPTVDVGNMGVSNAGLSGSGASSPPPSAMPPSRPQPPGGASLANSRPPSMAPPSAPPSGAPPPLPSSGPPPSVGLPPKPAGPPPSSSGGRPVPAGGNPPPSGPRPQPPPQQVAANQAFAKPSAPPSGGPPPMPSTASVGPPSQRIPTGGPPPMPSTAPGGGPRPVSSPAPPTPSYSPAPVSTSGGGGGGFYGPPPGFSGGASGASSSDAPASYSSMSDKERSAASSKDTVSGVTKDKKGLPISKTTHKGAHLLGNAAKAKGPSRRPPSTMIRK